MASVSKKGNRYYIRISIDGNSRKIYGFTNKRVAERTGEKIESLLTCRTSGGLTDEIRLWLKEIENSDLYDKLATLGLVEERTPEKTLYGLLDTYKTSQSTDVSDSTIQTYERVDKNLRQFFGMDLPLSKITKETAVQFAHWLKTEKLNRRGQKPQPYGTATVNKRLGIVKQFFKYAETMGWILKSPFQILKSGDTSNPDKLEYVPVEKVLQVMEYCPLKWRIIVALGRFCGLRGASEVHSLEWENVHWSSREEAGWIGIKAGKNRCHGRRFRMVPLPPVVEQVLSEWFHQAQEGEPFLFPGMNSTQNFSVMTEKLTIRALGSCWLKP